MQNVQMTSESTVFLWLSCIICMSLIFNRNWLLYQSASSGTCHTFNSGLNTNDPAVPRRTSLTGNANGLTLEIFLDQVNNVLLAYHSNTLRITCPVVHLIGTVHEQYPFEECWCQDNTA